MNEHFDRGTQPLEARLARWFEAEVRRAERDLGPEATAHRTASPRASWVLPRLAALLAAAVVLATLIRLSLPIVPSASAPTTPPPSPAQTGLASPVPVAGGCAGTQVYSGPGPDADLGLDQNPWALAAPASSGIVAYFWLAPPGLMLANDPNGGTKVLWIDHNVRASTLVIDGHPAGSATPSVHVVAPAASSPQDNYPSGIDVPVPGCWQFDLTLGNVNATMSIDVVAPVAIASPSTVPSPPAGSPSPSEIAAARAAVDAYTQLLVKGDWTAAYAALAPTARTPWGSLANFKYERAAYFKSVAGRYSVDIPAPGSLAPITDWEGAMYGTPLDLAHAVLVRVDYPALAGNNAGWELYIVQPGPTGLQIFDVR